MLLALGSERLDVASDTLVVGISDVADRTGWADLARWSDILWLRGAVRAEHVIEAGAHARIPIAVDAPDGLVLAELAQSGAVLAEVADLDERALGLAVDLHVTLWCAGIAALRIASARLDADRVVVEGDGSVDDGVPGFTVSPAGPQGWGLAFGAVRRGARIVRTTDPRSIRRVVAVTDRLVAARSEATS